MNVRWGMAAMYLSAFELFRIGPGPSSSATVGPQRAALRFVHDLAADGLVPATARVEAESTAAWPSPVREQSTDRAIVAGLCRRIPRALRRDGACRRLGARRRRRQPAAGRPASRGLRARARPAIRGQSFGRLRRQRHPLHRARRRRRTHRLARLLFHRQRRHSGRRRRRQRRRAARAVSVRLGGIAAALLPRARQADPRHRARQRVRAAQPRRSHSRTAARRARDARRAAARPRHERRAAGRLAAARAGAGGGHAHVAGVRRSSAAASTRWPSPRKMRAGGRVASGAVERRRGSGGRAAAGLARQAAPSTPKPARSSSC